MSVVSFGGNTYQAQRAADQLEAIRTMAERSSWQGDVMTWASMIGAVAAIVAAVFAALAYYRPRAPKPEASPVTAPVPTAPSTPEPQGD